MFWFLQVKSETKDCVTVMCSGAVGERASMHNVHVHSPTNSYKTIFIESIVLLFRHLTILQLFVCYVFMYLFI